MMGKVERKRLAELVDEIWAEVEEGMKA